MNKHDDRSACTNKPAKQMMKNIANFIDAEDQRDFSLRERARARARADNSVVIQGNIFTEGFTRSLLFVIFLLTSN
jgi:hypothetical protein